MVTYSGDIGLHSFSMNMLSDEADTFVIWCMRRLEKGETRSKYGVHSSVSTTSELGNFVVGRKPDWVCAMFRLFYGATEKSFKCCPFLNNKDLQSHGKQKFRTSSMRLTLRRLMSYIYIYIYMEHPFLMFLDHTQRRSTVGRTPLDE